MDYLKFEMEIKGKKMEFQLQPLKHANCMELLQEYVGELNKSNSDQFQMNMKLLRRLASQIFNKAFMVDMEDATHVEIKDLLDILNLTDFHIAIVEGFRANDPDFFDAREKTL